MTRPIVTARSLFTFPPHSGDKRMEGSRIPTGYSAMLSDAGSKEVGCRWWGLEHTDVTWRSTFGEISLESEDKRRNSGTTRPQGSNGRNAAAGGGAHNDSWPTSHFRSARDRIQHSTMKLARGGHGLSARVVISLDPAALPLQILLTIASPTSFSILSSRPFV